MRAVIVEHFRLPFQCAGSEVFMHRLGKALRDAGHEVTFITTDTPMAPQYEVYDGMPCFSVQPVPQEISRTVNSCRPDLIITHHQRAQVAVPMARGMNIPSVFVMHNDFVHNQRVLMYSPSLTIFNTQWIEDKWKHRTHKSMVIHPPVLPGECDASPGDKVTLINLNRDKGSEVFYAVAENLPHIQFLGVVGAHGRQYTREDLPNVEIQPHTANMCGDVWRKTRVLMMPSIYESYGMTGVEACYQGIPVLANPTPGLLESLGPAGWFISREDVAGYTQAVEKLYTEPDLWIARSEMAVMRGEEINAAAELEEFVRAAEQLVNERNGV